MTEVVEPGTARILIVEDSDRFAEAVKEWLGFLGYSADRADSAESGLQMLQSGAYDVLLVDLKLPGLSGHALVQQLKRLGSTTQVVVMSGSGDIEDPVRALREGVVDYLKKPFGIDELTSALERAVKARNAEPAPRSRAAPAPPASTPPAEARAKVRPEIHNLTEELRRGTVELPVLDSRSIELQRLLAASDFETRDVIETIGKDPTLSAAVMRTANSAFYARGGVVGSLHDACIRIGPRPVIGLALEIAMRNQYKTKHEPFKSALEQMSRNAFVTSRIAVRLAKEIGRRDEAEVFLAALLHNLGELLCLQLFADIYGGNDAAPGLEELAPEIARVHEEFGSALAKSWALPDFLVHVIGHHHRRRPGETPDEKGRRKLVMAAWAMALKAGFLYLPNQNSVNPDPWLRALRLAEGDVAHLYVESKTWTT